MSESSHLAVLVAENEAMVATSVEEMLGDLGHRVLGPLSNLPDLLRTIVKAEFDIALLDVTLSNGQEVYAAADRLAERGIPFAFMTADQPDFLAAPHLSNYVLTKPFSLQELVDCL